MRKTLLSYFIVDYLSAILSWMIFFFYRIIAFETNNLYINTKFFLGIALIPLCWLLLHYMSGFYNSVIRKSGFQVFGITFIASLFGSLTIFFTSILDDAVGDYKNYYLALVVLFGFNFLLTYLGRSVVKCFVDNQIKKGYFFFNTLIVGAGQHAQSLYLEYLNQRVKTGERFVGYIATEVVNDNDRFANLQHLGSLDCLIQQIEKHSIDDILIACDENEMPKLNTILMNLPYHRLNVRIIPDLLTSVNGSASFTNIYHPLITLLDTPMPQWQKNIKNVTDFSLALTGLFITLPISLVVALLIYLTSKGGIFYSHERIGLYGKPFKIYKFRSMIKDAEHAGPQLASKTDARMTKVGRYIRKWRLDEIPNFINVLKGEMSIVGPRPERTYYIDQILKDCPQYIKLQRVKPGITSLGQVKYGYAENVQQMLDRARYDLLYVETVSLWMDVRILFYTISTVFKGHGL